MQSIALILTYARENVFNVNRVTLGFVVRLESWNVERLFQLARLPTLQHSNLTKFQQLIQLLSNNIIHDHIRVNT